MARPEEVVFGGASNPPPERSYCLKSTANMPLIALVVVVMMMMMMMTMMMMMMMMTMMMMVVKIKLLQIKVVFPSCTKSHAECATDMHRSEQDDTENQSQSDCSARIQDWAAHIQDQPKSGKP